MILEANKVNMRKILKVLDKDLIQAYTDLIGILEHINAELAERNIKAGGKFVIIAEAEK